MADQGHGRRSAHGQTMAAFGQVLAYRRGGGKSEHYLEAIHLGRLQAPDNSTESEKVPQKLQLQIIRN